jgi:hypothetical protein
VRLVRDCVPLVALLPDQPLDAVQEVALVDDHVSVEEPPLVTEVGLAESETVGRVALAVPTARLAAPVEVAGAVEVRKEQERQVSVVRAEQETSGTRRTAVAVEVAEVEVQMPYLVRMMWGRRLREVMAASMAVVAVVAGRRIMSQELTDPGATVRRGLSWLPIRLRVVQILSYILRERVGKFH